MRAGNLKVQTDGLVPSTSGEDEEVECKALEVQGLTSVPGSIPEMAGRNHHVLAPIHTDSFPQNLLSSFQFSCSVMSDSL